MCHSMPEMKWQQYLEGDSFFHIRQSNQITAGGTFPGNFFLNRGQRQHRCHTTEKTGRLSSLEAAFGVEVVGATAVKKAF